MVPVTINELEEPRPDHDGKVERAGVVTPDPREKETADGEKKEWNGERDF